MIAGEVVNRDRGPTCPVSRAMLIPTLTERSKATARVAENALALLEQFGMSASANENDQAAGRRFREAIHEQEIPTDVAFPMPVPIALERMIEPFRAKRRVVGDQQ